jgi:asparagine synthase (glutamine-hydrolysing)
MDQPTMDGLNTYLVSRYARAAGVKVALSGLGGDELFAGYSSFRTVLQMQRFSRLWHRVPDPARRAMANAFSALAPEADRSRKLFTLAYENGNLLHAYFLSRMLFTPQLSAALFPSVNPEADQRVKQVLADALAESRTLDPINQVSYLEMRCYMLNTLLRDADCMSMAHGLELRVPLLDQQVARKVFLIPGQCKLSDSVAKPLLVSATAALPAEVVHRPKQGFTLPFQHWLRGKLHDNVDCTLKNVASGPLGSILQPSAVVRVWQDFLRGRTSWSRPWSLYVLQRWSEMHLSEA